MWENNKYCIRSRCWNGTDPSLVMLRWHFFLNWPFQKVCLKGPVFVKVAFPTKIVVSRWFCVVYKDSLATIKMHIHTSILYELSSYVCYMKPKTWELGWGGDLFYYFMCINALPAYMYMDNIYAWCLWRLEKSIPSLGTRVLLDSCKLPCRWWESNLGTVQEQRVFFFFFF